MYYSGVGVGALKFIMKLRKNSVPSTSIVFAIFTDIKLRHNRMIDHKFLE